MRHRLDLQVHSVRSTSTLRMLHEAHRLVLEWYFDTDQRGIFHCRAMVRSMTESARIPTFHLADELCVDRLIATRSKVQVIRPLIDDSLYYSVMSY